jgi:hypothetical protein
MRIKNIDEAWIMVGTVRADLKTAQDENELFECRTGCAASARQKVLLLKVFVGELLDDKHGRAKYASRQELVLPEAVFKLSDAVKKICG